MKISTLRIQNFRCLRDVVLELEDTTLLIGPNSVGKSAILDALRIALSRRWGQEGTGFTDYDFHQTSAGEDPKKAPPIVIEITVQEREKGEWKQPVRDLLFDVINLDPVNGLNSVSLRVTFAFEDLKQDYQVASEFLSPDGNPKSGTSNRALNFQRFYQLLKVFHLSAIRDAELEFRPKSRFWGNLIRNAEVPKEKWDPISQDLEQVNSDLLNSVDVLKAVKSHLSTIDSIVTAGAAGEIDLRAVPLREFDLLSRSEVVVKGKKSDPWLPLERHGQGVQSLAVVYLFQAFVKRVIEEGETQTWPVLLLEEPEAHLHPQAARSLGRAVTKIGGSKLATSHSPYFTQEIPFRSIRRLRRGAKGTSVHYLKRAFSMRLPANKALESFVSGHSQKFAYNRATNVLQVKGQITDTERDAIKGCYPDASQQDLRDLVSGVALESGDFIEDEELNKLETWLRRMRGEVLFAEAWVLVEGQTDHIVFRLMLDLLGFSPDSNGIAVIDYQYAANGPVSVVRVANAMGYEWIMTADGDAQGQAYLKLVQDKEQGRDISGKLHGLPVDDIETFLIRNGFRDAYLFALSELGMPQKATITDDQLIDVAQKHKVQCAHIIADALRSKRIAVPKIPAYFENLRTALAKVVNG